MRYGMIVGLAACLGCITAEPLPAEVVGGSSLEWLTCQAELVVVGRIEQIVSSVHPNEYGTPVLHEISFRVTETIKGQGGPRIVVHFRSYSASADEVLAKGMRAVEPMLLFLARSKVGKLEPIAAEPVQPLFDLTHPVPWAFDSQGRAVFAKERILQLCRDTEQRMAQHLQQQPSGRVVAKRVWLDAQTAAGKALYRGSATYLLVPEFTVGDPP